MLHVFLNLEVMSGRINKNNIIYIYSPCLKIANFKNYNFIDKKEVFLS